MTSRVQKGGLIFKPLARQKSRPAAPSQPLTSLVESSLPPSEPSIPVTIPVASPDISVVYPSSSSRAPPLILSRPTPRPLSFHSPTNQQRLDSQSEIAIPPPIRNSRPLDNSTVENMPAQSSLNTENTFHQIDNSHVQSIVQHPEISQDTVSVTQHGKNDKTSTRRGTSVVASGANADSSQAKPSKKRKRLPRSKPTPDEESGNDEQAKKPRKRRARKQSSPSFAPFDPSANPGEPLDPTSTTMASLCDDTGQGRVSSKAQEVQSNHAVWKTSNRERIAKMKAIAERKKYGLPEEEEGDNAAASALAPAFSSAASAEYSIPDVQASMSVDGNADQESFDYSQNLAASRFHVQVRIGANNETIIDEESLFVDRPGDAEDDTRGYTHVIETDRSKFTNSSTYGTKLRGSRWSKEETELFYDALSRYGENYEFISLQLPGRDRKSCKNKFKAEDKKNPARINHCLNNSLPVDIELLSRMTGRDFSGPVPTYAIPRAADPVTTAVPEKSTEGATQTKQREASSSKPRKRSRSRTTAAPEEGLMIIGDLDTFLVDDDS
ncbi:hypothetical protein D9757_004622 [Collybiopsis confluens]|uniref:Myb-like domain-containing protein n=1 Tax=Collybiopsis confluens TaxID=2823264 RepID=A0A8H5MC55_9AGAR|nr:hypothetical protein D9757_004622 [Collybiopsis confluens]